MFNYICRHNQFKKTETMKKLFLLLTAALFTLTTFSQTTIVGDNQCTSPYCGCDVIKIQRTGVPAGEWVELVIPTNIIFTTTNGLEITIQSWGWKQADATGTVTFDFNASLSDAVVSTTIANGWVLPAGTYQITTRYFSDKTGVTVQSVNFSIIGNATTAITTAVNNKKKAHPATKFTTVK